MPVRRTARPGRTGRRESTCVRLCPRGGENAVHLRIRRKLLKGYDPRITREHARREFREILRSVHKDGTQSAGGSGGGLIGTPTGQQGAAESFANSDNRGPTYRSAGEGQCEDKSSCE